MSATDAVTSYPPKTYKGIVALQMRNHAEVLDLLMERLAGYLRVQPEMEHYRGKLLVVEVNRIRIRELGCDRRTAKLVCHP